MKRLDWTANPTLRIPCRERLNAKHSSCENVGYQKGIIEPRILRTNSDKAAEFGVVVLEFCEST